VILRQPLAQTRRHQQHLLTITAEKVLGHDHMVLKTSDATALCNSHCPTGHCALIRDVTQQQHDSDDVIEWTDHGQNSGRSSIGDSTHTIAITSAAFARRGPAGPRGTQGIERVLGS